MSCLNPEPCSGNCPSPLSWLAFAHKTVTLVLTGIYRWGKRAVTHTHTQAADHKRTHKLKLEFLNVHTHTQVHTQRQIVRIPTHIFVVFYVCVCVCVWECKRWGSSFPRGSSVGKLRSRQWAGPSGPRNTDLYVSSRKWNHPFLCQLLCVCEDVCVHAWWKQWGDKRSRALLWTLSLCYKSLRYAVCILFPFELLPSLLLTAVSPLSAPLVSSLQPSPSSLYQYVPVFSSRRMTTCWIKQCTKRRVSYSLITAKRQQVFTQTYVHISLKVSACGLVTTWSSNHH